MNRREAIQHVTYLSDRVAGEFCVTTEEYVESDQETREALRALGVTDAEIDEVEEAK